MHDRGAEKTVTEYVGIMVAEFKRLLNQIVNVCNRFIERIWDYVGCLTEFKEHFQYLPSKEKYRVIRRINRCGFSEKEINLMVYGTYHCRNNC